MIKFITKEDFQGTDFYQKSVAVNQIILRSASIFAAFVELFNIIRVLFLSNSGLGTPNNRIYFTFYMIYFLGSIAFIIIDFVLKPTLMLRYYVYSACAGLVLMWHTAFNIYDIISSSASGNFSIVMAITIFSSLFMTKPLYAMACMTTSYLTFVIFLSRNFGVGSGEVINYTITAVLCVLIYTTRYKHLCVEMSQAKMINDIKQELSETKRKFQLSSEQYEMIRKGSSHVTFEWNVNTDVIRFSDEWTAWFDKPQDIPHFHSFIKSSHSLMTKQKEIILDCLGKIKSGKPFQKIELMLPLKNGENSWFELRVTTQTDAKGRPNFGIGILSDITEQKEKMYQLEQEIQMDLFTGLLNKTAIEHYGERKLEKLQKGETLAALILDMDDFKSINDHFGHPVGDYVLKEVAEVIRRKAPEGARVGRIGGDEFIILLMTNDLDSFKVFAEDLILELSYIRWRDEDVKASCSIGISAANYANKCTYSELYEAADNALYHSKQNGKKQVTCSFCGITKN